MDKAKEAKKLSLFAGIKKGLSGLIKVYLDDVKSNSNTEPKVLDMKFEDFKKQTLELAAKKKDELKLTKDEIKESFNDAVKSVKEIFKGEFSTSEDFFKDFMLDDDDLDDFDFEEAEEDVDVPVMVHESEDTINRAALTLLFEIAASNKEFGEYLANNEIAVRDMLNRVKIASVDPSNYVEPPILDSFTYREVATESLEAGEYKEEEIESKSCNLTDLYDCLRKLKEVYQKENTALLAAHSVIHKAEYVFFAYFLPKNTDIMEEARLSVLERFVKEKVVTANPHYGRFVHICKDVFESEVDSVCLAIALRHGFLDLRNKYPEVYGCMSAIITGKGE